MTDQTAGQDVDDEETPDAPAKRKLAGKQLVLFVALPLLLLTLLGGGAYFFLFFGDSEEEQQAAELADKGPKEVFFVDVPEMLVNLNTGGKRTNYLKVSVTLELDSAKAAPMFDTLMPRIIDNFQIYLRELRLEDLSGAAGPLRLKEELLVRINKATGADHVKDILFKEMLVQ